MWTIIVSGIAHRHGSVVDLVYLYTANGLWTQSSVESKQTAAPMMQQSRMEYIMRKRRANGRADDLNFVCGGETVVSGFSLWF